MIWIFTALWLVAAGGTALHTVHWLTEAGKRSKRPGTPYRMEHDDLVLAGILALLWPAYWAGWGWWRLYTHLWKDRT